MLEIMAVLKTCGEQRHRHSGWRPGLVTIKTIGAGPWDSRKTKEMFGEMQGEVSACGCHRADHAKARRHAPGALAGGIKQQLMCHGEAGSKNLARVGSPRGNRRPYTQSKALIDPGAG